MIGQNFQQVFIRQRDTEAQNRLRDFTLDIARETTNNLGRRFGVIFERACSASADFHDFILRENAQRLHGIGVSWLCFSSDNPRHQFHQPRRQRHPHIYAFVIGEQCARLYGR